MRLTVITSFNSLTIGTELDFKSEYLFRMCSVVTNLVTSLESQPIRWATMLFHIGRTRNVYVATRVILLSMSFPNAPAKLRRELVEMWNELGYEPSLFQTKVLIDVACNHESFSNMNFIFHILFCFFNCVIVFIPFMEISSIFCSCLYFLCRRGNNHFDVQFRRIGPVIFLSKDGKIAVREGRNGRKGVYFSPESASFPFDK